MFFGKGRMGSNYVWGLSFGTIVFLGIREAAENHEPLSQTRSVANSAQTVKRIGS